MEIYTIISKFAKKGRTQRRVAKVYIQKIMEENNKTITDIKRKRSVESLKTLLLTTSFRQMVSGSFAKTLENKKLEDQS